LPLGMAGFPLQPSGHQSLQPSGHQPFQRGTSSLAATGYHPFQRPLLSDADHEDQMPTHVIWGDVESLGRTSTAELSGSRTGSDTGKEKKKLINKRLSRDDIQFRSPERTSPCDSSEVGTNSQPIGRAHAAEVLHLATDDTQRRNPIGDGDQQNDGDDQDDSDSDNQEELPLPKYPQQVEHNDLSPEELEVLMSQVRRTAKGHPTSVGSACHPGNCKPCLFVFTKVGCQNNVLCTFCHFKHKRGNRPRPCKGKRNRYRKLMARMEQLAHTAETPGPNQAADAVLVDL